MDALKMLICHPQDFQTKGFPVFAAASYGKAAVRLALVGVDFLLLEGCHIHRHSSRQIQILQFLVKKETEKVKSQFIFYGIGIDSNAGIGYKAVRHLSRIGGIVYVAFLVRQRSYHIKVRIHSLGCSDSQISILHSDIYGNGECACTKIFPYKAVHLTPQTDYALLHFFQFCLIPACDFRLVDPFCLCKEFRKLCLINASILMQPCAGAGQSQGIQHLFLCNLPCDGALGMLLSQPFHGICHGSKIGNSLYRVRISHNQRQPETYRQGI